MTREWRPIAGSLRQSAPRARRSSTTPDSACTTRMPRAEFHVLHERSHMSPFLRPDITAAFLRAGE